MAGKPNPLTASRGTPAGALLIVAALGMTGCAARAGRVPAVAAAPTAIPSAAAAAERAVQGPQLRDPLAAATGSRRSFSPGNGYRRLVTAGLDGLSRRWNREQSEAWDAWAANHLQDGDLLFVQAEGNLILGVIDFSKLTREVTGSPFTHMGIVAVEQGEVVVYDTVPAGPGRKSFGQTMALPDITGIAVKRLRPYYQPHVPGLEYCRRVHAEQIGFDKKLRIDNDELYCTELVEVAFRSTGLPLSQPVRWNTLPGYQPNSAAINAIRIANQTRPDDYVVLPGDDQQGIWASPALELVLDLTPKESPPPPHAAAGVPGSAVTNWPS